MPHEIRIDGATYVLRDECSAAASVRIFRTASGDALVMTRAQSDATHDGVPVCGDLCIVRWGSAALVRVGGRKIEIAWRAGAERRPAAPGARCRTCFGRFEAAFEGTGTTVVEEAISCACLAVFHVSCDSVRLNCPTCGLARLPEVPA